MPPNRALQQTEWAATPDCVAKPEKFVPVPTSPIRALERSRLRGGRFACNTPDVMRHDQTAISMELLLAGLTPLHMIEIP
jgi:hypothetical protein